MLPIASYLKGQFPAQCQEKLLIMMIEVLH